VTEQNHFYAVRLRQFGNGLKIVFDHGERRRPGIAGDVVGAGIYEQGSGLEGDHIRKHTHQHLRSSLSADAAVYVGLAGKVLGEFPTVGDGIAEKYYAAGLRRQLLEPLVVGVVPAELIPVLQLIG